MIKMADDSNWYKWLIITYLEGLKLSSVAITIGSHHVTTSCKVENKYCLVFLQLHNLKEIKYFQRQNYITWLTSYILRLRTPRKKARKFNLYVKYFGCHVSTWLNLTAKQKVFLRQCVFSFAICLVPTRTTKPLILEWLHLWNQILLNCLEINKNSWWSISQRKLKWDKFQAMKIVA